MKSCIVFSLCLFFSSVHAQNMMTYIYNAPESKLDKRYEYQWTILKTALQRTIPEYGPFRMRPSTLMSESRQVSELVHASGEITVMYLDSSPKLEKTLVPIRIPVDKDLVGYRILLIRKSDRKKFESITTLGQLQKLDLGQGLDWIDVKILRENGFKIVTGSSYEGLFDMLIHKRFDAFPRGAVEIMDEFNERKRLMPELFIEPNLLIFYPLPMYFWFSDTDEGRKLASRAEAGMREMISDGTYDRIFTNFFHDKIQELKLKNRKIFRLRNPFLSANTPFNQKELWFDPDTN